MSLTPLVTHISTKISIIMLEKGAFNNGKLMQQVKLLKFTQWRSLIFGWWITWILVSPFTHHRFRNISSDLKIFPYSPKTAFQFKKLVSRPIFIRVHLSHTRATQHTSFTWNEILFQRHRTIWKIQLFQSKVLIDSSALKKISMQSRLILQTAASKLHLYTHILQLRTSLPPYFILYPTTCGLLHKNITLALLTANEKLVAWTIVHTFW